jgi:integrase
VRGSIQRRGKFSWRIQFEGPRLNGVRKMVKETVRCATRKEAQAKLNERLAALGRGEHVEPSKLKVAEHVRARIDIWKIGNSTRERYKTLLKKQIAPHIGEVMLQRLSTIDVERWHSKLLGAGLSPVTVRHAHKLLRKAIGDAQKHSMVPRNVAALQRAPAVPKKEMQILTREQVNDVVDRLRDHEIFPKAMLALYCGLRAGEILALSWRDLKDGILHVRGSVEEVAGEPLVIKRPKTADGIRRMKMPAIVIEALRDHERKQNELRLALGQGKRPEDALVFPHPISGDPTRRTALSLAWSRVADELGVGHVTLHGLRHTSASMLLSSGVDVVTVSKRLGHADPSITLRVYAHIIGDSDDAAADALDTGWTPKKSM